MVFYQCKCIKINLCECGTNWMCKKCGNGFGIAPHTCYEDSFKRGIEDIKEGRVTVVNNLKKFIDSL